MLEISDLHLSIGGHEILAIDRLRLAQGERLGLVGESGSGKTMTAMSIVGLQPNDATTTGSITVNGQAIVGLTEMELSRIRGSEIGVVFQDPLRALNPVMRVGRQVTEAVLLHEDLSKEAARHRTIELLEQVQLPNPEGLLRRYPHQLSGGQRQRVLIAIAIAARPKLLIADEPTTALDVTVQRGILDLLLRLSKEQGMALLFVSHDLGVVQSVSERIAVLYAGQLFEVGPADDIAARPRHRYTEALIASNPGQPDPVLVERHLGQPLDTIPGSVPALGDFPDGCHFRGRCAHEVEACSGDLPVVEVSADHWHRCWNPALSVPEVAS
jgi:peptide/nickel transport system ATP-binding protein